MGALVGSGQAPCSLARPDAALNTRKRLKELESAVVGEHLLLVILRVMLRNPRTTIEVERACFYEPGPGWQVVIWLPGWAPHAG